jgi:murein DD-endopeptidase MepM/ murein hydrolase activator NlpD
VKRPSFVVGALVTLVFPQSASAQAARWISPPVEMRVPKPPVVAPADGRAVLAYELHLTNWFPQPFTIQRVEVVSADGRVLLALADSTLARALGRPGMTPANPSDRTRLGGGMRGVIWLWVPVDIQNAPAAVRHRATVQEMTGADSGRTHLFESAATPVSRDIVTIGPPLRGGAWLTANGPSNESGHRRALIPIGGLPVIAQRFAIDYVRVDTAGRTVNGDRANNANFYAQSAEALAVADGIVVSTKDSIPENIPGPTSRAVPINLETVGGNFVILDIGSGRYAFYAHLQPGSLRVRTGERVRRGQVLGLVGNSGNSTEPHLHFHIADANSALGSEGIPYVHEAFDVLGRCTGVLSGCTRHPRQERRRGEMPLGNMIIAFPE